MNLYLSQKPLSWKEKFTVVDDDDNVRYTIDGQGVLASTLGSKELKVTDQNGNEVAKIVEEPKFFAPSMYEIFIKEEKVCGVAIESSLLKTLFSSFFIRRKMIISGLPYQVDGLFWGNIMHDYKVMNGSDVVMHARTGAKKTTLGNSYLLDIADDKQELLCLCLALAVSCAIFDKNK